MNMPDRFITFLRTCQSCNHTYYAEGFTEAEGYRVWALIKRFAPGPYLADVQVDGATCGWKAGTPYVVLNYELGFKYQAHPLELP